MKGISAGCVPDRSFFLLPLLPLLSHLHPSLSPAFTLNLVAATIWILFKRNGGGGGGQRGGGVQNEKDRRQSPTSPPNHFFLPPLTSLAWKRKVSARVVMVKSQSHRFVFHLEDHRSISEPRTHNCEINPRNCDCRPTSSLPRYRRGCLLHSHWRGTGGKSQRAFSFKFDGLLPSCLSPPPLPLGWPRQPGPSDPSSPGPCLQTEGR